MSMQPDDLFQPDDPAQDPAQQPQQGSGGAAPGEFIEYNGRQIPVQRFEEVLAVQDWIANGGQETFQKVADIVSGRARVAYEPPAPPPAQPSSTPAPGTQSAGGQGLEGGAAPSWDPRVDALARDMLAIRQAQAEEATEEARADVTRRYNLTDDQAADLIAYATQERIVENRARARGRYDGAGNFIPPSPRLVLREALDMAYRQKYFGNAPVTPQQVRRTNQRVVGSSAPGQRRATPAPVTQEEHDKVLDAELHNLFGMPLPEDR